MNDRITLRDGPLDRGLVADVSLNQRRALEALHVGGAARVRQQVVDNDLPVGTHPMDVVDEIRPDESRAARYEESHQAATLAARYASRPSRQSGSSGAPRSDRITLYAGRGAGRARSAVEPGTDLVPAPARRMISTANSYHEHCPP